MNRRKKYISDRILFAVVAGVLLFVIILLLFFYTSIHAQSSIPKIAAVLLTLIFISYILLCYKFILLPIKETMSVYKEFAKAHVWEDMLRLRYPFSKQSEAVIERMKTIFNKDKLLSISKKEAQYLALQNQINPHFLYNTLEGIRSEAIICGLDSVAEMTEALATFFRYTISHLENLVSLEDELENIENYFYIQQFRFGDRLALKIEYDNDVDLSKTDTLSLKLPKLTLQPLVENAIYHGIEKKVGKGHIIIKITITDERLIIKISDDGIGMSEEKLQSINLKLKGLSLEGREESSKGGIALINVNDRIKLLFGEDYGLYLYSQKNSGTDIEINLPAVRHSGEKWNEEGAS